MTQPEKHILMWSGPRNISTAMMRAWENRPDTTVVDEPLYAHYLDYTGLDHPGRDEVIAHGQPDWRKAVAALSGPILGGKRILYQKHMAHHLLSHIEFEWMEEGVNCFLIREPREMLTSLVHFLPEPRLVDTGLPQQVRIFDWIGKTSGRVPPVLDGRDVLEDPRRMLEMLCDAVGVPFFESMLHWPPGPRPSDGVWAKYWYANVEKSTGFAPYKPKPDRVPEAMRGLLDECNALYNRLHEHRLV